MSASPSGGASSTPPCATILDVADQPTFVERVPQVFSVALAACVVAFGLTWDSSKVLSIIALAGAAASLFLRLWLPLHRRRKYGY